MVGVACVALRAVRLIVGCPIDLVRSLSVVFHRLFSMRYDSSAPLQIGDSVLPFFMADLSRRTDLERTHYPIEREATMGIRSIGTAVRFPPLPPWFFI